MLEWATDRQWTHRCASDHPERYHLAFITATSRKTGHRAKVLIVGPLKVSWGKLNQPNVESTHANPNQKQTNDSNE